MGDESLRDYGVAAPHGPNRSGQHVATANIAEMNANEAAVFRSILLPDDSYDENGVYWADMPIVQRLKFTSKVDSAEAKSELAAIWRMTKADPLSPIAYYVRNMVIPGAGLLLEGYTLFSIGNLKPLFAYGWNTCWSKPYTDCDPTWVAAVDYLEVVGIICGQILVGVIGDWLGRRWGLIQDALIMFIGLLMLISSWGTSLNGWVICYAWSLWFYGLGVGGEYPMTATSGMENAVGSGKISTRDDRLHRGRKVTSAFLMQGWGQFLNQVILLILLLIFNQAHGNPPYSQIAIQWTYRVSFAIPAVGTLWLVYYRTFKMRSASKQLEMAKKKSSVTGYDVKALGATFSIFGGRVIATAGAWFCNDVFFYGNKLFQSDFIQVLTPNATVTTTWLWNLVNIGCALAGYYMASFLIDNKNYGRKWMQFWGFLLDFILFLIPALNYDYYAKGPGVHAFQAMYFLSSFFNQFGPNSVTFIVAAEVYPTPVRATAHGFSAAVGKLGALFVSILFNYIPDNEKFLVGPWFGLAGALLTVIFLPDTTGLDLKETERRWAFIRAGRSDDYHGIAIHPRHLSWWERFRGVGKHYDAELDYKMRVEEMRADWEAAVAAQAAEKEGHDHELDDDWSEEVSGFFKRTETGNSAKDMSPFKKEQYGSDHPNIDEEAEKEKSI